MKTNLKNFKGKTLKLKVKDARKNGKSIYRNISGHGNEINYVLTDMSPKKTGFKRLIVSLVKLYPGKVNREFKMSRGHKHNAEEVYIFLEGTGQLLIGKKRMKVKKWDVVTIPAKKWHRTINTGRKNLVYLNVFEKHRGNHLKK
jgi:oxalate decarboxylase/phosphoglucose isomerase-like protein (cupin superfamily)